MHPIIKGIVAALNSLVKPKPMPSKPLITYEQLQSITDTLNSERCRVMADLLNELCTKYGITDKLPFQMFLANCIQESGEFAHKEENMNYSASRIVAVWPSRFNDIAAAQPFARNPEALSNEVYGGRMGNNQIGDGFKFKGSGFIGITGRELYTKYATYINKSVNEAAELMRTTDRYALDSACWFFAILRKLIPIAKTGDFKTVCKKINGGLIGYSVREQYYKRCQQVI